MINAYVIGWTDGKSAEVIEDEHGFEWSVVVDALDGTIAVDRRDGLKAGIFTWTSEARESGCIAYAEEGATYGINSSEDFIVSNGEWEENS